MKRIWAHDVGNGNHVPAMEIRKWSGGLGMHGEGYGEDEGDICFVWEKGTLRGTLKTDDERVNIQ